MRGQDLSLRKPPAVHFEETYEQIDSFVQTIHRLNTPIEMKFGMKKYHGLFLLKKSKKEIDKMEGNILLDG